MSKITLEVNENHLSDLLIILKSLKNGMINKIDVEAKNKSETPQNSKYLNKQAYKDKLNLPNTIQSKGSRYLSPEQFKQKLYKDKV